MQLFFFGSLMDMELLALVTGRPVNRLSVAAAVLHGFERRRAIGESFPIIVPHPGGRVEGVVVGGLAEADLDRILFFEGVDYALRRFTVECAGERVEAGVFLPTARLMAEDAAWDVAAWAETERAMCFALAEELMSHYGALDVAGIEALWPAMKARAFRRFRRARREAKRRA
jgi:hypothetical protein